MNKGEEKNFEERVGKGVDRELFFQALGDRTRLRLLNLMGAEEVCVCFFTEVLGESQPKISRHLAYLRRAGLVRARREGKWMHYRVTPPAEAQAARVLDEIRVWLAADPEMQRDCARLRRICCAPQLPVALRGAPRPSNAPSALEQPDSAPA